MKVIKEVIALRFDSDPDQARLGSLAVLTATGLRSRLSLFGHFDMASTFPQGTAPVKAEYVFSSIIAFMPIRNGPKLTLLLDTSSQYITRLYPTTMLRRIALIKLQAAVTPDPKRTEENLKALRKNCQVLNARNKSRKRRRNKGVRTKAGGSRNRKTTSICVGKSLVVDCATSVRSKSTPSHYVNSTSNLALTPD